MLNTIEASKYINRSVTSVRRYAGRKTNPMPFYKLSYGYIKIDGIDIKVEGNFYRKNLVFIKEELDKWKI